MELKSLKLHTDAIVLCEYYSRLSSDMQTTDVLAYTRPGHVCALYFIYAVTLMPCCKQDNKLSGGSDLPLMGECHPRVAP